MARTSPNVTDAEWAVLERLWDQGPASIRQLTDVLYPKGGASEYATVHKLLERLEAKKFVQRKRVEGVYLFETTASRDDVVARQLRPHHRRLLRPAGPRVRHRRRERRGRVEEDRRACELRGR